MCFLFIQKCVRTVTGQGYVQKGSVPGSAVVQKNGAEGDRTLGLYNAIVALSQTELQPHKKSGLKMFIALCCPQKIVPAAIDATLLSDSIICFQALSIVRWKRKKL